MAALKRFSIALALVAFALSSIPSSQAAVLNPSVAMDQQDQVAITTVTPASDVQVANTPAPQFLLDDFQMVATAPGTSKHYAAMSTTVTSSQQVVKDTETATMWRHTGHAPITTVLIPLTPILKPADAPAQGYLALTRHADAGTTHWNTGYASFQLIAPETRNADLKSADQYRRSDHASSFTMDVLRHRNAIMRTDIRRQSARRTDHASPLTAVVAENRHAETLQMRF